LANERRHCARAVLTRALSCIACLVLAACSSITAPLHKATTPPPQVYQNERFQADETFSRLFDAKVATTCEAARRALLSQGYVITRAEAGVVNGAKRFQPEGEVHVEIAFNVVCVPEGKAGALSTAFVSAQQDRYAVKKSTNATSIGVSAIGSISVPLSSTQESLVKVASETIPTGEFYDRFFALMQRLLAESSSKAER
jgi:hypothetical protein